MERILQVFYVLFSAFITAAAIQNEILPFGSPFLGLIALIPLYIALMRAGSYLQSALLTSLQIFAAHLMSSFWLANFKDFALFTLGASALGTAFIGFVFGCYLHFPVSHSTQRKTQDKLAASHDTGPAPRILYFAAVWTLYEWAKSNGFLGYPWGTLLMSSWKWPAIIQIADITGVWGITFLFAFFSAVMGEFFLLRTAEQDLSGLSALPPEKRLFMLRRCAAACILLFVSAGLYGAWQLAIPRTPVKTMNTIMVQHNVDSWNETGDDGSLAITVSQDLSEKEIIAAAAAGTQPDLAVWSESVIPYAMPDSESYYTVFPPQQPLAPFIYRQDIPFIIGGPVTIDRGKRQYGNSAVLFGRNGEYKGSYSKMQLVPFAEVIPYGETEWMQRLLTKLVGFSSGWTPGQALTLFDIPIDNMERKHEARAVPETEASEPDRNTVRISTPICFEDAFPAVCRALFLQGSEVFVNITNDSWSRTDSAEYQHFAVAAFRAVEFRTTMVRVTNSGYSVVIDPTGRILHDLPLFESASCAYPVPVYGRVMTIYARFGDWLPFVCFLLVAAYIILECRRQNKDQ